MRKEFFNIWPFHTASFWIVMILMLLSSFANSQHVVVSSYLNAADPRDEWTELLVIQDNLDMRNWMLRDNSATQAGGPDGWQPAITFNNIPLWNHMRAGTIILVWHRAISSAGTPNIPIPDVDLTDGYIEVAANDGVYFTGGTFNPPANLGPTLNIAGAGDIVQLRTSAPPAFSHVHALGHKLSPGADFIGLSQPKLNHAQSLSDGEAVFVSPGTTILEYGSTLPLSGTTFTAKAAAPNLSRGLPNLSVGNVNSNYWRLIRQPQWATPGLTAVSQAGNTQVLLTWNTATDPFSSDGTIGYIILRSPTNSFIDPIDGVTYLDGDVIGSATVIQMPVQTSQTVSWMDNIAVPCGTTVFYRIYAYRYAADNLNGNNYDTARGRAYNETNFGFTQVSVAGDANISSITYIDASCGLNNGIITVTASGTATPLTYSIDNGTTYQTSNVFSGLAPGNYLVMAKDANGCTTTYASNPVVIGMMPGITNISVLTTDATCFLNNGSLTITPTGGALPLLFSINNGATYTASNIFNSLASASYVVMVKDANNCVVAYASNPVVINNIGGVTSISATPTDATCGLSNGTILISATGGTSPLQYSIDNGVTYQASSNFTGLSSGNYIIVVLDGSNCAVTYSNNPLVVGETGGATITTANVTDAACGLANGSIIINATGGLAPLQYSIDSGITWQLTNIFSNLAAGSYSVVVNDANNCQTAYPSNPVIVNNAGGAAINAVTSANELCGSGNGSINVDATGGTAPLQYSIDNGTNWQSSNLFAGLTTGNYIVVVIDGNNCETYYGSNPVIVGSTGGATITTVIPQDATCGSVNGNIAVSASGGASPLQYSVDNGINWQLSNLFTNLNVGNYTVIVQDANNCQTPYDGNPVNIASMAAADILGTPIVNTTCGLNNGSITVITSGGATPFQFSIDMGITWQFSNIFTNLISGSYTVIVKDANNCQSTSSVLNIIDFPAPLVPSPLTTNATNEEPTGSASTMAIGTPDLEYSIDGGITWQNSGTFQGLMPGNYTMSVRDGNGCISLVPFSIGNTLLGNVILKADSNKACPGSYVEVSIIATGMIDFMNFNICLTYNTSIAVFSGIYDVNGLLSDVITDSSVPGQLMISWTGSTLATIPNDDLLFRLRFTGLTSGTCLIEWTDFNPALCGLFNDTGLKLISVFNPGSATFYEVPNATISGSPDVCEGFPIVLDALGDSLMHQWSLPGGGTFSGKQFTKAESVPADNGLYILLSTNNLGCSNKDTLDITIRLNPEIIISLTDPICSGYSTVLQPGSSYVSYLWQDGSLGPSCLANDAGEYILRVTDQYGCMGYDTVNVEDCQDELLIPDAFTPNRDGLNDSFHAIWNSEETPSSFSMIIYNRWSRLIYEGHSILSGWDGQLNGEPCPGGVYTYIISFEKPAGKSPAQQKTIRGLVTLIR